jgi:hypothetical protein
VAAYAVDWRNDTEWIGGLRSARLLTPAPVAVGSQIERVASFPIEVPDCATDPADERAAEQATTTLGAP